MDSVKAEASNTLFHKESIALVQGGLRSTSKSTIPPGGERIYSLKGLSTAMI